MAIKKTTGKAAPASSRKVSKSSADGKRSGGMFGRYLIFYSCLLLVIALLAGIAYLIWEIPKSMVYGNERFKLRAVEVKGSSYWGSKPSELLTRAGISLGTNIFTINVGEVRRKVCEVENIYKADVQLMLPDKIIFDLGERTPIAKIGKDRVIDDTGQQFMQKESSVSPSGLPTIAGNIENKEMLKNALKLVGDARRNYSRVKILFVMIQPSYFEVILEYRNQELEVIFPKSDDYLDLFRKLESLLLQFNNKRKFDLRFPQYAI